MKRHVKKNVFFGIAILLMVWSGSQIFNLVFVHDRKEDPLQMLFQVSSMQIELMNNSLAEAAAAATTNELDALKHAVYSANYTHEHLVLAVGKKHLHSLDSLTALNQYILRLQIGGNRQLREHEANTLQKVKDRFDALYQMYHKVLDANGETDPHIHQQMVQLDQEMTAMLKGIDID